MYILNAFSANMLAEFPAAVSFEELTLERAKTLALGTVSAVGHADTAAVFQASWAFVCPSIGQVWRSRPASKPC